MSLKDHHHFARFILSVCFAKHHELGWDPTIERRIHPITGIAEYDITVRDDRGKERKYRTKRCIFDEGAAYIRGRGTRVWEVVGLNEKGEESDKKGLGKHLD